MRQLQPGTGPPPTLTRTQPTGAVATEPPERTAARWPTRYGVPLLTTSVVLVLFPAYRYGIGLDGLSYLSVAEAYAAGDWTTALNAYWSPLYSWIHVPLLALGVAPLDAATLVAAPVAGGTMVALGRLVRTSGASDTAAMLVALAVAPFVVFAAQFGVFADLLLCALLLAATADLLDDRFRTDPRTAARAGAFLGLAYLTKLYALPFALALLPVVFVLHRFVGPPRTGRPGRSALVCAGALLLVAAPWVTWLSLSEGEPTIGTAASHNIELVAPGSQGNPIRYGGLLEPPEDGASSAWQDPSGMPVDAQGWGESKRAAVYRVVENVERNSAAWWGALVSQGAALLVAAGVSAFALARRVDRSTAVVLLGVLAAAAVYSSGYLLTWVEDRYAWFVLLLLAVPVGRLLDRIGSAAGRTGMAVVAAALLVALSPPALDGLALKWDSGRELAGILATVDDRALVPAGGAVASEDNWQRSAILCFSLDCAYHGHPAEGPDPARLAELRAAGIDRYLVWSSNAEPPGDLPLLDGPDDLGGLRVYEVPSRP